MVLGYVLYEIVDLTVAVLKLTANGARAAYRYIYGNPAALQRARALEDIEQRLNRLEMLEKTKTD